MTSAVPAALAALFVGLAAAAQHRATHEVDVRVELHPWLVLALLRRRTWLLGVLAAVTGFALQVVALAGGSIVVVQTVMVSSLAWTTAAESVLARRRPARPAVLGVVLVIGGIVGLLALLRPFPAAAPRPPTGAAVYAVVGGCAVVCAVGLVWAAQQAGPSGALGLALATGCGYGLSAALLKLVVGQFRVGWDEPLRHPALYAACLLGPAAVLLSQSALQQGHRATPAVAVVLIVDPLVGLVTGVAWFGEGLTATTASVLGALGCVVVTVAGIALAHADGRADVSDRSTEPRPADRGRRFVRQGPEQR